MTERAFVGGKPATLDDAIAAAASRLAASRMPVICGLVTDAAGTAAAVRLAARLDAALDHEHAEAALRDLDAMREGGWIVTTPLQTRARADLVLLVGRGLEQGWPGMITDLALDRKPTLAPERERVLWRLGAEAASREARTIATPQADMTATLGALRAVIAGRKTTLAAARARVLAPLASSLKAAAYGVIVWSAGSLSWSAVEMLTGLVDDLNETTRFACLPLPAPGNAAGVVQSLASLTGAPLRLGFSAGRASHDPWRYDPRRLAEAGEADQLLWIGVRGAPPPEWAGRIPMIVLQPAATPGRAAVAIDTAEPGIDHASALFDQRLGAIAWHEPAQASAAPSVASLLDRITALC